jgi:glycosyltransferase involved in cell wall biosynthesis
MKVTVHTLIKNEQRWIWYALLSVLDYVDEIMVWDTGSTDDTVSLVESIKSTKIKLIQIEVKTPEAHTAARQQMLENTDSDWIMILDGDEVWWSESVLACLTAIKDQPHLSGIISPFINVVGDVFHFQSSKSNHYQIGDYHGSYNLRFINRKIPGLHVGNPHGRQEYRNNLEVPLQHFPKNQLQYVDKPYLHTTHLQRSVTRKNDLTTLKRDFKYRVEFGHKFAPDFVYPEVLYYPKAENVPNPFTRRSYYFELKSLALIPLRAGKRALIGHKSGY